MNTGLLNIYACSGVGIGSLSQLGLYHYWTAGTVDYLNTIAFNSQLACVNEKMAEYEYLAEGNEQAARIANEIDLHICILQVLIWNGKNSAAYPLDKCGRVIDRMVADGLFDSSVSDDDARADNLDNLIQMLVDRINTNLVSSGDSDFMHYWQKEVVEQNYNGMPEEMKERLNDWFASAREGAVGDALDDAISLDPKDFDNLSDYVKSAGTGFLYLWIDDIDKYSWVIRKRRRKEEEVFDYIYNNCAGIYSRSDLKKIMRCGIIEACKSTPEYAIKALETKGDPGKYLKGGVGAMGWDDILYLILIAIIVTLATMEVIIQCIQDAKKAKYDTPIDYEQGIPDEDDFGISMRKQGSSSKLVWIGLAAAGAYLLMDNNKNN